METQDIALLQRLPAAEPSAGTLERILRAIDRKRLQLIWTRLALAMLGLFSGVAYAAYSWTAMWGEVQQSSFVEMARLWLTDSDIMLANVNEAVMGALEFIPWGTMMLVLVLLICAVGAIGLLQTLRRTHRATLSQQLV